MKMPQNIATPANLPPINSVNKKNNADARKKSSIMLSGGGGGSGGGSGGGTTSGGAAGGTQTTTKNVSDSDYYFTPALSEAKRNKVTTIGNLAYTIAQGKIIDCVLETAINTDLPGIVRAIISRDVFAEAGKNILIPKGSRLIGSYTANVAQGQSRVSIVWNRLIRPDGIDMSITSNAIDKLGRAGVNGDLDNKYFETLGNAMLLSIINIGAAAATQKITNAQNPTSVTTTNGNNTVTQNSGNATDTAVQNAISTFNSTTNGLVQNALKVTPTVTIDQGTIVKVLINQDVIFPADLAQGVKIIQ
jgi:type IV secretion system protein VirB10